MAHSTHVFPDQQLGVAVFYDAIDVDDFIESLTELYTHDDWDPTFDAFWDCREVSSLVLDPSDAATILDHVERLLPQFKQGRAAFVVPRLIDYLMARMLLGKMTLPNRQHKIFRRAEPAMKWLCHDETARLIDRHTSEILAD